MIQVNDSVEINRPVDQVFDFLADIGNAPRWQRGVVSSRKDSEGPMRVGTTFTENMRVMGMSFDARCEVTAFEPPRRIAMVADGKLVRYHGVFQLEPVGAATQLSVDAQVALKGFWRLLSPLMGSEIRKESAAELQDIRRVLEAG
jgi:carbon monoxide dehydrogenase subunit G